MRLTAWAPLGALSVAVTVLVAPASAAGDCQGVQDFGAKAADQLVASSDRLVLASAELGGGGSPNGWVAVTNDGKAAWSQRVQLGAAGLGMRVLPARGGPVAAMTQADCDVVMATATRVSSGQALGAVTTRTNLPQKRKTNPNVYASDLADLDADGVPDQAVETRVRVPGESDAGPVSAYSSDGRDVTLEPRSGSVVVLSPAKKRVLYRWDYDALEGPGPMSAISGTGRAATLVIVKRTVRRHVAASGLLEHDTMVEGRSSTGLRWSVVLPLLRDAQATLEGPSGPILVTRGDPPSSAVGIAQRIVALERETGKVLWRRDWLTNGPLLRATSRGDVLADQAGEIGGSTGTVSLLDGRTGKVRYATSGLAGGDLGNFDKDGFDDSLFHTGYTRGIEGKAVFPKGTLLDASLVPVTDADGDGADDVWAFDGNARRNVLLAGRDLHELWSVLAPPVPGIRPSTGGRGNAPRLAATTSLAGRRLVVAYVDGKQRFVAYDARDGSVVWTYRACERLSEPDKTVCLTEP